MVIGRRKAYGAAEPARSITSPTIPVLSSPGSREPEVHDGKRKKGRRRGRRRLDSFPERHGPGDWVGLGYKKVPVPVGGLELACAVHLRWRRGRSPKSREAFREMGHWGASSSSAPGNPRAVVVRGCHGVSDQMNTHRCGTRQIKVVGRLHPGQGVQTAEVCVVACDLKCGHDWDMGTAGGRTGWAHCLRRLMNPTSI